jgi:hypothetical protein
LSGRTFLEASFHYPNAILVGVMDSKSDTCNFCPDKSYELKAEEDLVLIAKDSASTEAALVPVVPPSQERKSDEVFSSSGDNTPRNNEPENITIIGWNDDIGLMLLELDGGVAPHTKVQILAPTPTDERDALISLVQNRESQKLVNLEVIQHIEAPLNSRYALENLPFPVELSSRIFILAHGEAPSVQDADTSSVCTLLQIRDLLQSRGVQTKLPMVMTIRDPSTAACCEAISTSDFIDMSSLPSQIVAMIAYEPRIACVLDEMISDKGSVHFNIKCISSYMKRGDAPLPDELNFFEVCSIVSKHSRDLAVGWSVPSHETEFQEKCQDDSQLGDFHRMILESCQAVNPDSRTHEWAINPEDKLAARPWTPSDRVVVLGPSLPHDQLHADHFFFHQDGK